MNIHFLSGSSSIPFLIDFGIVYSSRYFTSYVFVHIKTQGQILKKLIFIDDVILSLL